MAIALLATIIFGLSSVLLSLENDRQRKDLLKIKKTEQDKVYKLSVIKEVQGKIAYAGDPEKVIDIVMVSLRNFFDYSTAASMAIKDAQIVFKVYIEDEIGEDHFKKIEESMLSSFEKLVGKVPLKIDRKIYGVPINNAIKSTYSSSFHIPLVANNRVLALIHLSSIKENAFVDMDDLHELVDSASSALTHFSQSLGSETEKFSSLINSMNDGILMTDDKNNLLTINNAAKNILGITSNASFFDALNVFGQNINLKDKINKVLLTKSPLSEKQIQVGDKMLDIFLSPVGLDKVSVILRDMTEFKKKEMQKEDLIHIMVHELRAPVTTIKDSAELIITTKDSLEENKKLKFLEIIHTQAKKVLGQIGSILDTAKLDAGKLVLQKTTGDIAKLIADEIRAFMPQAERKNITLNFEILSNSLPEISYDEIRISQVIDNLLSNSLKFTPEGGKIWVELDYRVVPPVLDGVSPMGEFLSLDKYVTVSVSDNGVGISPQQQKLLFSKYTQAKDTSEKLTSMGTGLGLYLAKGIIESHDGRIWVKSVPGQCTTFSFTLPATEIVKASYEAPKPTTTPLVKLSQTVN
jgi:signal transduction histidine kinase/PAS domain-containing protein